MANNNDAEQAWPDFQTAFCEHFGCAREAFQEKLFWRSVPPRCRPFAFLLRRIQPDFFREDFEFLTRLGQTASWAEFTLQANGIRSSAELNHGFLRRTVRVRISGARLLQLREEIMSRRRDATRRESSGWRGERGSSPDRHLDDTQK